jgi:hypothetical protein
MHTSLSFRPLPSRPSAPRMRVYALTSSQCLYETLDLFLTREAAEAELREILHDEPDWKDVLRNRADRARRAQRVRELDAARAAHFKFRCGTTRLKCPRARSRLHRRGRRYRGGGHRRRPRGLVRLAPRGPTAASASQLTSACVSCGSRLDAGRVGKLKGARTDRLPSPTGAVSPRPGLCE